MPEFLQHPFFSSPFFLILVGLIVGVLLGKADTAFTRSKRENREKDLQSEIDRLKEGTTDLQFQLAHRPAETSSAMSIVFDEQLRPVVKLDGEPVSSLNPDQRQRMIGLINILRPLLEGRPVPTQAQPGFAPPAQKPAAAPVTIPIPAPEVKPVPVTLSLGPAKKQSQELVRPSTIAAQIDEILQAKLTGHPLAARGIKVRDSLTGGVEIFVGAEKFEGVGDVTYPDVKALLQETIAEWEKKYTPGL